MSPGPRPSTLKARRYPSTPRRRPLDPSTPSWGAPTLRLHIGYRPSTPRPLDVRFTKPLTPRRPVFNCLKTLDVRSHCSIAYSRSIPSIQNHHSQDTFFWTNPIMLICILHAAKSVNVVRLSEFPLPPIPSKSFGNPPFPKGPHWESPPFPRGCMIIPCRFSMLEAIVQC